MNNEYLCKLAICNLGEFSQLMISWHSYLRDLKWHVIYERMVDNKQITLQINFFNVFIKFMGQPWKPINSRDIIACWAYLLHIFKSLQVKQYEKSQYYTI